MDERATTPVRFGLAEHLSGERGDLPVAEEKVTQ